MSDAAARSAILRWWLAYFLFAVFLLLPGETRSPFSGITLSSRGILLCALTLVLAVFTAFFRPARPVRLLWSGLLLAAIIGKLLLAPALVQMGWRGEYSTAKKNQAGHFLHLERTYFQSRGVARPYRIDRIIDYEGVTFGLSFINDFLPNEFTVQRDVAQPLLVRWTGYMNVVRQEQFTIPVQANGGIFITVDGHEVLRGTSPRNTMTNALPLSPGSHKIVVAYAKLQGLQPGAHVLLAAEVTPVPAGMAEIRKSRLANAGITGLGILAILALACAFLEAYRPVRVLLGETLRLRPDKVAAVVFAAVAILAGAYVSIPMRHATMQLGVGDDPLVYEAYARLIVRNGIGMLNDNGTGQPYYFYPLYSYVLAAAHVVFGDDTSTIILLNLLCIAAIGPLLWALLRNRLQRYAIVVALAVSGLFVRTYLYRYALTSFTDNLFVPMVLAVLVANVAALTRRSIPLLFLTGALTALGAATRPSLLIHVPFVALLLLLYRDFGRLTRRFEAVAVFIAGFAVAVSPFTLRNWLVSGHFHLLVTNYVTLPIYLFGPGDVVPDLRIHGELPGLVASVGQFFRIFASRPLHFAQIEMQKVLFTLGLTAFGPPGSIPRLLYLDSLLFGLALWSGYIDKAVAAVILTFCASHMAAMVAASPYTYGYKTILPFHMALIAGAAFLLKFKPRPFFLKFKSRLFFAELPRRAWAMEPSVTMILTGRNISPETCDAFLDEEVAVEVLTVAESEHLPSALLESVRKSQGNCVVLRDGEDGCDRCDADDIRKLLAYACDFDVVLGSRVTQVPLWRRGFSEPSLVRGWIVAKYIQVLYNTPTLTDACCGLRLMRRGVADIVCEEAASSGAKYPALEMLISTLRHGYHVVQVPVTDRSASPAAVSLLGNLVMGCRMIALVTRRRLRDAFRRRAPRTRTA